MRLWHPSSDAVIVHLPCEWCGESHAPDALCQHTKSKGITRRSFLFMGGVGVAALVLMPKTLIEEVPPSWHGGAFAQVFKEVALAGSSDVEMEVAKLRALRRLEREGWQAQHL